MNIFEMFPPDADELEQILLELEKNAEEAESEAEWKEIQFQIAERKKQFNEINKTQ